MSQPIAWGPFRIRRLAQWRDATRREVVGDLVAGLSVTALAVPYGMAYAQLAGVPAVNGLYTTVVAMLAYAVIGPSRVLLLGPDSALAPLIAAAVALVVSDGDPAEAVAVAGMLALMTGVICVVVGAVRLGALAELLSRPVQVGYLNGLAIVMVASQLGKLAGFSTDGETVPTQVDSFIQGVDAGEVNGTTLILGLGVLVTILVLNRIVPAVPSVFVAVVGAILAVEVLDLTDRGVAVVGRIPTGFPAPAWPGVGTGDLWPLLLASIGLAWVTLTDTTALSRGFASRLGERVEPDAEIAALGVANLAAGVFQGFPVSASTSRTSTAHATGGRTQLVGVLCAALVLLLLVAAGGLVEHLPDTALAAVVVVAALHLFDLGQLSRLARVRRSELLLCLAATAGVVFVGVLDGIVIAVFLSLANFIRRVWRPYDAVLGRVDYRRGYHDIARHPDARLVPGLILFRFDAPLFFANAEHFARRVREVIAASDQPVRRFVVTAEPISDIDTTAAEVLVDLIAELRADGIEFGFAEMKGPVKDRMRDYGIDDIVLQRSQPTVGRAVASYVEDHGVEWSDWSDA